MAGLYPDHHKLQKKDKTRKKRKMSSKKDMIQPDQAKTKKTHVRRQSIYSGKPNCEYYENINDCVLFCLII